MSSIRPAIPDFMGEVISSLKVVDTAIFVMNAVEGVQVGTELAWNYAEEFGKPSMFVINHLDKGDADFRMLIAQMKERFGYGATVVQLPAEGGTRAIIDVLLMKQLTFPEGKHRARSRRYRRSVPRGSRGVSHDAHRGYRGERRGPHGPLFREGRTQRRRDAGRLAPGHAAPATLPDFRDVCYWEQWAFLV